MSPALDDQHEKRDRLPADDLLRRAAAPIQDWWQRAYLGEASPLLASRFADEARASLPGIGWIHRYPLVGIRGPAGAAAATAP
jgi:hypothetical protein